MRADVTFPWLAVSCLPACRDGPFQGRSRCSPRAAPDSTALSGLNSVLVVGETVPLTSYHPGKHSWRGLNKHGHTKQSRTLEVVPCVSLNTEPAAMSFALRSDRGGVGKRERLASGYHWQLLIRVIIYTTSHLLRAAVLWTHLSFGTAMTQAKPLWNGVRYSHVLTGTLFSSWLPLLSQEHFLQHWATFQA